MGNDWLGRRSRARAWAKGWAEVNVRLGSLVNRRSVRHK